MPRCLLKLFVIWEHCQNSGEANMSSLVEEHWSVHILNWKKKLLSHASKFPELLLDCSYGPFGAYSYWLFVIIEENIFFLASWIHNNWTRFLSKLSNKCRIIVAALIRKRRLFERRLSNKYTVYLPTNRSIYSLTDSVQVNTNNTYCMSVLYIGVKHLPSKWETKL